ncbi:hypothetical protein, partial [Bradyrhizobium sp. 188]|uniref:hypothetical protein n=1 Tax=Bradyrhizobium sp. 188 TaxID=2782656 RepID=UPI001FF9AA74
QNRRCLNGSDAALDTKAIRQKRGRHRAEKIALTEDPVRWSSARIRTETPRAALHRKIGKRQPYHSGP